MLKIEKPKKQKKPKSELVEDFIFESMEHRVLKQLILQRQKENKYQGYGLKNSIIESVDKDGNSMLFAAHIDIDGLKDFNVPNEPLTRQHKKERLLNPLHPVNIERITFIVNGQEVEFVRCQG